MMGRKFPTKWNSEKLRWDDPPTTDCSADFKAGRMAVQADRESADVNNIFKRLNAGQSVLALNKKPFYGDVSEFDGLADAIMKVRAADDLFMSYDADLREKFDNDPVKFVEFLENPANLDEAVKLGLADKAPEIVPTPAVPVPPANLKA